MGEKQRPLEGKSLTNSAEVNSKDVWKSKNVMLSSPIGKTNAEIVSDDQNFMDSIADLRGLANIPPTNIIPPSEVKITELSDSIAELRALCSEFEGETPVIMRNNVRPRAVPRKLSEGNRGNSLEEYRGIFSTLSVESAISENFSGSIPDEENDEGKKPKTKRNAQAFNTSDLSMLHVHLFTDIDPKDVTFPKK